MKGQSILSPVISTSLYFVYRYFLLLGFFALSVAKRLTLFIVVNWDYFV